jgi:hypothetical protein
MGWISRHKGTLDYSGRLPCPSSFDVWADTDGHAVVTELASKRWFSLLGKRRAAKKEVWRELQQLAERGFLADEIRSAVSAYTARMADFALERSSLPRMSVDLRRVFVVPRAPYNAWAYRFLTSRLASHPGVVSLKGGTELASYFCFELLNAADTALFESSPTVRRPLRAGSAWSIVGADSQLFWAVPFERGPEWRGHYYVYEMAAEGLTRARRKELTTCMKTLEAGVSELSRLRKIAILSDRSARI